MYFQLKMGIFQPAMLVYQRVMQLKCSLVDVLKNKTPKKGDMAWGCIPNSQTLVSVQVYQTSLAPVYSKTVSPGATRMADFCCIIMKIWRVATVWFRIGNFRIESPSVFLNLGARFLKLSVTKSLLLMVLSLHVCLIQLMCTWKKTLRIRNATQMNP